MEGRFDRIHTKCQLFCFLLLVTFRMMRKGLTLFKMPLLSVRESAVFICWKQKDESHAASSSSCPGQAACRLQLFLPPLPTRTPTPTRHVWLFCCALRCSLSISVTVCVCVDGWREQLIDRAQKLSGNIWTIRHFNELNEFTWIRCV